MGPRECGGVSGRLIALLDDSIQIRFASPKALREEFEKNMSNRGIFIATDEKFVVRQAIEIEIVLSYVEDSEIALSLPGEVVHWIPAGMTAAGGVPGVAVQFNDSAAQLHKAFEPLLERGPSPPEPSHKRSERRASERGAVRVPTRIMPAMSPPFEATSRDLSVTGVLLTMNVVALPIGESVRTCLWHPSGEPSIEIDGQVVRHVRNRSGEVVAVAIAFDRAQLGDSRVVEVIEALRQTGHRSRLGSINGSIADLGLANLLQMFDSSVPEGTLIVEHGGEQGWIAFAEGQFLAAELGAKSDQDALVEMLSWSEGDFRFEASADEALVETTSSVSLVGAVLKAMVAVDELRRGETGLGADGSEGGDSGSMSMDPSTTFAIDTAQEDLSRSSLDKTAEAVLELARTGMSIQKLEAIIPEPPDEVQLALEELVELGVLMPR